MRTRDGPASLTDASSSKIPQQPGSLKRRPGTESVRGASPRSVPVVLVGPYGLFAEGLQQILRASNFRVIAGLPTFDSAEAGLLSKARLVIVMDPTEPLLAQIVSAAREEVPDLRFVLLVDTTNPDKIAAARRVPAHAFLCQKIGCEPLTKALDVVLGGGAVLSLDLMAHLMAGPVEMGDDRSMADTAQPAAPLVSSCRPLSEREIDILRCLTVGDSNKLIARRFKIAESTVKIHIKGILRKINVQNRTQAAIWAMSCMPPLQPASEAQRISGSQPTA